MEWEVVQQVLKKLSDLEMKHVDLGGWGEVTIHPQFLESLKLCSQYNFKTSFTTNGLNLNPENIKEILRNQIEAITLSVDSLIPDKNQYGHNNSCVWENLKALIELRKGYNTKVRINTMVHKQNHDQILDLLTQLDEAMVDMVVLFGPNVMHDPEQLRLKHKKEIELYQQIEKERRKRWNAIVSTPLGRYQGQYRGYWFSLGEKCPQTWSSFYINQFGQVTPCSLLPDYSIGELANFNTLEQLWLNPQMKEFRYRQSEFCKNCDALKFKL
jgi:MoaA/NifB/PqqE/SkfB family radical SAM enzyme